MKKIHVLSYVCLPAILLLHPLSIKALQSLPLGLLLAEVLLPRPPNIVSGTVSGTPIHLPDLLGPGSELGHPIASNPEKGEACL